MGDFWQIHVKMNLLHYLLSSLVSQLSLTNWKRCADPAKQAAEAEKKIEKETKNLEG